MSVSPSLVSFTVPFFLSLGEQRHKKNLYSPEHFNIAVHVRRGDILNHRHLLYEDEFFINSINHVLEGVKQVAPTLKPRVHIFSDGSNTGLQAERAQKHTKYVDQDGKETDLQSKINCRKCIEYHTNEDMLVTFHHFYVADVLISGVSMFSSFASAISQNIHLCSAELRGIGPRQRVAMSKTGTPLSPTAFQSQLQEYLKCNPSKRPAPDRSEL